jgi:hypothetical protein
MPKSKPAPSKTVKAVQTMLKTIHKPITTPVTISGRKPR